MVSAASNDKIRQKAVLLPTKAANLALSIARSCSSSAQNTSSSPKTPATPTGPRSQGMHAHGQAPNERIKQPSAPTARDGAPTSSATRAPVARMLPSTVLTARTPSPGPTAQPQVVAMSPRAAAHDSTRPGSSSAGNRKRDWSIVDDSDAPTVARTKKSKPSDPSDNGEALLELFQSFHQVEVGPVRRNVAELMASREDVSSELREFKATMTEYISTVHESLDSKIDRSLLDEITENINTTNETLESKIDESRWAEDLSLQLSKSDFVDYQRHVNVKLADHTTQLSILETKIKEMQKKADVQGILSTFRKNVTLADLPNVLASTQAITEIQKSQVVSQTQFDNLKMSYNKEVKAINDNISKLRDDVRKAQNPTTLPACLETLMNDKLQRVMERLNALETESRAHKQEAETNKQANELLSAELRTYNEEAKKPVCDCSSQFTSLRAEAASREQKSLQDIKTLQGRNITLKRNFAFCIAVHEEQKKDITRLKTIEAKHTISINSLNTSRDEMNTSLATVGKNVGAQAQLRKDAINEVRNSISKCRSDLTKRLDELETQDTSSIDEPTTSLEDISASLTALEATVGAEQLSREAVVTELRGEIAKCEEGRADGLQELDLRLSTSIDNLETKLADAKSYAEAQHTVYQADFASLKESSELQSQLSEEFQTNANKVTQQPQSPPETPTSSHPSPSEPQAERTAKDSLSLLELSDINSSRLDILEVDVRNQRRRLVEEVLPRLDSLCTTNARVDVLAKKLGENVKNIQETFKQVKEGLKILDQNQKGSIQAVSQTCFDRNEGLKTDVESQGLAILNISTLVSSLTNSYPSHHPNAQIPPTPRTLQPLLNQPGTVQEAERPFPTIHQAVQRNRQPLPAQPYLPQTVQGRRHSLFEAQPRAVQGPQSGSPAQLQVKQGPSHRGPAPPQPMQAFPRSIPTAPRAMQQKFAPSINSGELESDGELDLVLE